MQGFDELANILNHRTHRRYLDKPVPDELLEVLLGAAFSAPAKSDLQQASVVVIRDKDKQEAIANMIPDALAADMPRSNGFSGRQPTYSPNLRDAK